MTNLDPAVEKPAAFNKETLHEVSLNESGGLSRLALALRAHWIWVFALFMGLYVGLPFLAPVLMHFGWESAGRIIYSIYAFQCHQLPQRSFFFFGPKAMVSLVEVQSAWQATVDPLILRSFVGNAAMGWKVAWSDRMVSMYTSLLVFGLLWWPFRRRLPVLPWWGFILLLLPMAVDGTSHFFSDLAGIGQGFRDSNTWLATLTGSSLAASFYAGDGWGSFNSLMRLASGILFGLAVVWFGFAYIDEWIRGR